MSLVELIAQADERGLAVSGLACLDRCVPLLGTDDDVLRPLWASLETGSGWDGLLDVARKALDGEPLDGEAASASASAKGAAPGSGNAVEEAAELARRMLESAPASTGDAGLRVWADACSVASLRIHRLLDAAPSGGDADAVHAHREGRTDAGSPLVQAELRRQTAILELLAQRGASGLRPAFDATTEGRRTLRAVVSRRTRGLG